MDRTLRRNNAGATERLRSAGEETLASLLEPDNEYPAEKAPRLIVVARTEGEAVMGSARDARNS